MGLGAVAGIIGMSFIATETTATVELGFIKQEQIRLTDANGRIQDKITELNLKRQELGGASEFVPVHCDLIGLNPDDANYGQVISGMELSQEQQKMPSVSPGRALGAYAGSREFASLMECVDVNDPNTPNNMKKLLELYSAPGQNGKPISVFQLPEGPEKEKRIKNLITSPEFLAYFENRKFAAGGALTGSGHATNHFQQQVNKFEQELANATAYTALRTKFGIKDNVDATKAVFPETNSKLAEKLKAGSVDELLTDTTGKQLTDPEKAELKTFLQKANPDRPATCTPYTDDVNNSNLAFLKELLNARPEAAIKADLDSAKANLAKSQTLGDCSVEGATENIKKYFEAYEQFLNEPGNTGKTEADFEKFASEDPKKNAALLEIIQKAKTQAIANTDFTVLPSVAKVVADNAARSQIKDMGAPMGAQNANGNSLFGNLMNQHSQNSIAFAGQSAIPFQNGVKGVLPVCAKMIGTVSQILGQLRNGLQRGLMKLTRLQIRETSLEQQIKIASSARQKFSQMGQQGG